MLDLPFRNLSAIPAAWTFEPVAYEPKLYQTDADDLKYQILGLKPLEQVAENLCSVYCEPPSGTLAPYSSQTVRVVCEASGANNNLTHTLLF